MLSPTCLQEGIHIGISTQRRKLFGYKHYPGNALQICKRIIKDCWNGTYFQTSVSQYRPFYARDFGWCTEPLIKLGFRSEVKDTLTWALRHYQQHNGITVAINPSGQTFNFPNVYSPDSVAYFFRSLLELGDTKLISDHKKLLQQELDRFCLKVLDSETGIVRRNIQFSSMKDYVIRDASCYDMTMACMLEKTIKKMPQLKNPFESYELTSSLKKNYWKGDHFLDDLSGATHFAADANMFPFLFELFPTPMVKKMLERLRKEGLNHPFPLRYVNTPHPTAPEIGLQFLVPSWERSCIWGHLGMHYLQLLHQVSDAQFGTELQKYVKLVEKNNTFFELYTPDGKPYRSTFYYAESGMLWASILAELLEN